MNRTPRQHHGVAVASLHRQAFEPGADGALHKNSGAALQCPVTTARYAMRKKVGCDSVAQTQPRNRDPADRSLLRAVEHNQPFDQRQRERERRRRRRAQRVIVDVVQSLSLLVVEKPARTHGVSTGHPMQSRKQHQDGYSLSSGVQLLAHMADEELGPVVGSARALKPSYPELDRCRIASVDLHIVNITHGEHP